MKNFTREEMLCIQCQIEAVEHQTYCRNKCMKIMLELSIDEDGFCPLGKIVYDKIKKLNNK